MNDNQDTPASGKLPVITNLCAEIPYEPRTFQERAEFWGCQAFGVDVAGDMLERQDRFVEETFELLQAQGYDPRRISRLRNYVWGRPAGEPSQELGGVMLTLALLSSAAKLDMVEAGETELRRVYGKIDVIRAKQAAKPSMQPEPIALGNNDRRTQAIHLLSQALSEDVMNADDPAAVDLDLDKIDRSTALKAIMLALELRD